MNEKKFAWKTKKYINWKQIVNKGKFRKEEEEAEEEEEEEARRKGKNPIDRGTTKTGNIDEKDFEEKKKTQSPRRYFHTINQLNFKRNHNMRFQTIIHQNVNKYEYIFRLI